MQTIVFDNFAGGYFKLYRGGAAVFGNKIIGKDKKKSEHSFVTDLISFDNVIKVEQN